MIRHSKKSTYSKKQFVTKDNLFADLLFVDIVKNNKTDDGVGIKGHPVVIDILQYKGSEKKVPLKAISKTLNPDLLLTSPKS